jgi:hypothetical protein
MSHLTERVLRVWRAEGIAGVAARALQHFWQKPRLKRGYVLELDLDGAAEAPPPMLDVEVSQITQADDDDMQALADFHFYGQTKEDIARYLADGQRCVVARYRGRLISCMWILTGEFYDFALRRYFELGPEQEYWMGAYTLTEFRGEGIVPYLALRYVAARKQEHPDLHAVLFIDANNRSSLNAAHHIGCIRVGRVGFIELFGLRFHYLLGSHACPKISRRFFLGI